MPKKDYIFTPVGPVADLFMQAFSYGANINDLPERKKEINHGHPVDVEEIKVISPDMEEHIFNEIIYSDDKFRYRLSVGQTCSIGSNNKTLKRIFLFLLIKFNEDNLGKKNAEKKYEITVTYDDLVNIGIYSTKDSCKNHIKSHIDNIKYLKFERESIDAVDDDKKVYGSYWLFPSIQKIKSAFIISFNRDFDWDKFIPYFTINPAGLFRMSSRAFDLMYYISFIARQRVDEIKKSGYFDISMKSVFFRLNLPNPASTRNPKRTIYMPIINTINEVENLVFNKYYMIILPVGDESDINSFINEGYIRIHLSEEYQDYFNKIKNK